ncbi:MAG: hypothetical protein R3A78_02710 [Polyangiales bacterium]|nr:hypothetical protein [Myxococcales bacterium]
MRVHRTTQLLRWISAAMVLGAILALGPGAEAQRRKRRTPKSAPTAEPAAPPASAPASDAGAAAPNGDPSTTGTGTPNGAVESGAPASPAASAEPVPAADKEEPAPDYTAIRSEFTDVMDAIVQLRSRVAVLGRQLFQTRVRVQIHNRAGDTQSLARLTLTLDGAPIHKLDAGALGDEERQVFDGFAAPGPHVLAVELEQRSRDNDNYRYTMRDSYRFEVERGKATVVMLVLDDDSGIGEDFPDDGEGEYDVRTRVRVVTRELGDE